MRSRRHKEDTDLDLAPPAELLALRDALVVPPDPATRAEHLTAAATASRIPVTPVPVGRFAARFASRGAKAAVAVVAGLAITTGLAGAQLLPDPAQRLLSNVSERFAPSSEPESPPATAVDVPGPDASTRAAPDRAADDERQPDPGTTSTSTGEVVGDEPTPTTEREPEPTTTTIPGPSGPGSPTDPTDPGTTTTTTPPTTTTTTPPTTTTTEPPTTTTTEAPAP